MSPRGIDKHGMCLIRSRNCLPFVSTWVHPPFLVGSVLPIVSVSCVVLLCVFVFRVPCCDVRYDFRIKMMFRSYFTSSCLYEAAYLIYVICVCLRVVVSNTYCVVFLSCFSSSCVHYICMLPVSLDCPCLIVPSVFSNVYLDCMLRIT